MVIRRSAAFVFAAVIAIVIVAAAGSALAEFMSGENYPKAESAYQVGYVAGAIDMIVDLQASGAIGDPALSGAIAKISKCLTDQKIKQVQAAGAYVGYLKASPDGKKEPAALGVYEAMKIACKV